MIFFKTVTMRIQDLELKAGEGGGGHWDKIPGARSAQRDIFAVLLKNSLASKKVSYYFKFKYKSQFIDSYKSLVIFRNTTRPTSTTENGNLFGHFFVQNMDTQSFIRHFPRFATGLSSTALLQLCVCVNNLRQACWKQHCCSSFTTACTDLLTSCCGPVRTDRYNGSERIQISACWQQVVADLLQICFDLHEIGCVPLILASGR